MKDRWTQLSLKDKSELMKLYLDNGITTLADMRNHYNQFAQVRLNYKDWVNRMQQKYSDIDMNSNTAHYDYERYFNENYYDAVNQLYNLNHFPDTYKYPTHPTFSNESMYSKGMLTGGSWNENVFTPSKTNRVLHPELYGFKNDTDSYMERYTPNGVLKMDRLYANGGHLFKDGGTRYYTPEELQALHPNLIYSSSFNNLDDPNNPLVKAAKENPIVDSHPWHNPIYGNDGPVPAELQSYEGWQRYKNAIDRVRERPGYEGIKDFMTFNAMLPVALMGGSTVLGYGEKALNSTVGRTAINFMGRPVSTIGQAWGASSRVMPYLVNTDKALMGTLGAAGVYDAVSKGLNGEIPWYDAVGEGVLSGLMLPELAPALKGGAELVEDVARYNPISNRKFIARANNLMPEYEPIPSSLMWSTSRTNNAVKARIAENNRFVRGVRDSIKEEDVEKVNELLREKYGIENPTELDRLEYFATTYAPETGAGRAGMDNLPPGIGTIYTSNSLGTAKGYAEPKHFGEPMGKIAELELPYQLGADRRNWFEEGNVTRRLISAFDKYKPIERNYSIEKYGIPFEPFSSEAIEKWQSILRNLPDKYSSISKLPTGMLGTRDVENAIFEGLGAIFRDNVKVDKMRSLLSSLSKNRFNRNYNPNGYTDYSDLLNKLFVAGNVEENMTFAEFEKKMLTSINFRANLSDVISEMSHVVENASMEEKLAALQQNIFTTEEFGRSLSPQDNAYQHYIFTGPVGEKGMKLIRWIDPATILDGGSRAHIGNSSMGYSRKQFATGGKLTTLPDDPPVTSLMLPNVLQVQDNTRVQLPWVDIEPLESHGPIFDKKREVLNSWQLGLHNMENEENQGLVVTPTNDTLWYPYNSVEGGTRTIYDGLKLNEGTEVKKAVDKQGYLTNKEAEQFKQDAMTEHYEKAKRIYNRHVGNDGAWDKLSVEKQAILADYSYTGVLGQFKKLMTAFEKDDVNTIINEYERSYRDSKGDVHKLTKRNNYVKEILHKIYGDF